MLLPVVLYKAVILLTVLDDIFTTNLYGVGEPPAPVAPVGPAMLTPEVPDDPATPEVPLDPEDPELPEDPEDPEVPLDPEVPELPLTPDVPAAPVAPV